MSIEFGVQTTQPLPRSVIDPGLDKLRWDDDEPSDPVTPGSWTLFLEGISTRVSIVTLEGTGRLSVTIRSGACLEDCDLALGIVRRAAASGDGIVNSEEAIGLTLAEFDSTYDDAWMRQQLESAAGITVMMARREGIIALPGPTREVWIGPRVVEELENGDPALAGDRLVTVMRRVLWPDGNYFSPNRFKAGGDGSGSFTLAVLPPQIPTVLPRCDQVGLQDSGGTFMVPREALAELPPLPARWLDDGNLLVEATSAEQWTAVCQAARALEGTNAVGSASPPPSPTTPPSAGAQGPPVSRRWRIGRKRDPQ